MISVAIFLSIKKRPTGGVRQSSAKGCYVVGVDDFVKAVTGANPVTVLAVVLCGLNKANQASEAGEPLNAVDFGHGWIPSIGSHWALPPSQKRGATITPCALAAAMASAAVRLSLQTGEHL